MREPLAALILLSLGCGPESVNASGDGSSSDGATTGGSSTGASTTTTASTSSSSSSSESTESTAVDSSTGPLHTCGDGTLDANEECDDGNADDGDTCSSTCTVPFTIAWTNAFNDEDDLEDIGWQVAIAGDGSIYVAGTTGSLADSEDVWLRQYAPDGTEGWTFTFDGANSMNDDARGVAVHPSGDIIVSGFSESAATGSDALVLRVAGTDGSLVWQEIYDNPDAPGGNNDAIAVDVDANGDIVVGGSIDVAATGHDMWLRRYDAAGTEIWTVLPGTGAPLDDFINGVAVDADGASWVVGVENIDTGKRSWVRGYDADGALIDELSFDDYILGDVTAVPGGGVVVCGVTDVGAARDGLTIMLDADLATVWSFVHNGPDMEYDGIHDVAVGPGGDVYVAGYEGTQHLGIDGDLWLAKLAGADGLPIWSDRFEGGVEMNDALNGAAIGPDGSIVVAGYISAMGEDLNIWVRKYVEP